MAAALAKATSDKRQLLAHCNGDAAARQFIQAVSATPGSSAVKPVMIHAQLVGLEQLPQMLQLGIIPSFFVAHVWYWGDVHIKNFGIDRATNISPAHSALADGLWFTFHQDSPVIMPDMLQSVWCAVNRITKDGVLLGPDQRIGVWDALKAVTINAARQYSEESSKGSLAVGKSADMVVLDRNPLTVDPIKIKDISVLATIKDGQVLFERR